MKKILYLLQILLLVLTNACSNENIETDYKVFNKSLDFIILEDEAKELATDILNKRKTSSRNLLNSKVETIWRNIKLFQQKSKNTPEGTTINIPIYVISYVDNENNPDGYVVTIGDKRAKNKILAFSEKGSWNISKNSAFENLFWIGVDNSLTQILSNSEIDPCDTYEYEERYSVQKCVSNMLLEWNQSPSPYNDSVPALYYYNGIPIINAYAGCGPIAAAQIMAYHEYPSSGFYIHQEYNRPVYPEYNWSKIKMFSNATLLDNEGKSGVANLIAEIGYRASANYGQVQGTGTKMDSIRVTFNEMGYTTSRIVNLHSQNIATIFDNIEDNQPILIQGSNNQTTHAWVIDGYKQDFCDIVYGRDCPTESTSIPPTVIGQEITSYFHFNLGYGGNGNGFFLVDTFNSWEFPNLVFFIHDIHPNI